MSGNRRESLLYGAFVLTASNILSQLLGFLYRILLSRAITPEQLGLYQLVMPAYSVALSICLSGLTVASARLSSEYSALGAGRAVFSAVKRCRQLFFILFAALAVVVVVLSDTISVYALGDARTRMGLICLMPVLLLTGIENIYKNHFYGVNRFIPPAITEVIEMLVRMTAVLGLLSLCKAKNSETVVGVIVVGMIFCEIFSSAALAVVYRRGLAKDPPSGRGAPMREINAKIKSIAVPVALTNLLGNLISSANAILVPSRLVAAGWSVSAAMSVYGVLFGMTLPMLTLPMVLIVGLSLVLVPKLSESAALGDTEGVRRRVRKAMLAVCVFSMPIGSLFIPLGGELGTALFKNPDAGNYIIPLSICVTLASLRGILGTILNGIDRQKQAARNIILGELVELGCAWFLIAIPGVELKGYILGFFLSTILSLALNMICVVKFTGVKILWKSWFLVPATAALAVYFVVDMLFSRTGGGVGAALLCALAGVVLYAGLLRLMGIRLAEFVARKR